MTEPNCPDAKEVRCVSESVIVRLHNASAQRGRAGGPLLKTVAGGHFGGVYFPP